MRSSLRDIVQPPDAVERAKGAVVELTGGSISYGMRKDKRAGAVRVDAGLVAQVVVALHEPAASVSPARPEGALEPSSTADVLSAGDAGRQT